jgi:hypothetical protein
MSPSCSVIFPVPNDPGFLPGALAGVRAAMRGGIA